MRSNVVFRPTVVIGLGGTGHSVVLKLKRHFFDAYGSVPPIIKFLSLDTTENVEHSERARDGSLVTLEPINEQVVLTVANPGALVSGTNEHINEWWPRNIPMKAITDGAGQVRARGRLALFAKSKDIFGRIENAIKNVNDRKNDREMYKERFQVSDKGGVEIYIVGSLAGGTGSGMFLDIAFITRHLLDALSNITGVLVLPHVFSGLAGTPLVKPNAYGALKEIERFSDFEPDDNFYIDYGTHNVHVTRSPFDLLYLVDAINESGRVISEPSDLLSIIAEGLYIQIGSQIGTDSDNAVDNIKTQLAVKGRVRGRSAAYCSFGVASLVLPARHHTAMKIDAGRELLSDGLLNGIFPEIELEADVVRFIEDNKLKEENADEVIDVLSEREGGGRMRFQMPLGQMKFNRAAAATIKQLHTAHRSKMERQVAQGIEANYKRLLDDSIRAVDEWWERAVNRPNGLTYASRFCEKLLTKLEWYQRMMESESKEERERLKALNFKVVEDQIVEASGAFIKTETKVRAACENYKGVVDRECDLHLQVARRDKAAELYGALRLRLEQILLSCASIRLNLEAALKSLERRYLDASTTRSGDNTFEHVITFDDEKHRPEITAEEFVSWYRQERGSMAAWADLRPDDVEEQIMGFVNEQYSPLTEMPIEEVLRRSSPQDLTQDLNQLRKLAVPLWRYDEGKIPVANQGIIEEMFHYGVADADRTLLKEPSIFGRVPRGASEPSFVSTLDPQRITLFKVKIGVPLFALHGIEEMERAYIDPDKAVSNHLHRDWESFQNIIPRTGEGDALRWFAIAQAPPPFELITRRGDWYFVKSQQAKRTDGGLLRLGQGRMNAYSSFEKNRELVREIEDKVDSIVRTEGELKVNAALREYAEQLVGQVSGGNVDSSIKEQVEGEIQSVEDYLRRAGTIR